MYLQSTNILLFADVTMEEKKLVVVVFFSANAVSMGKKVDYEEGFLLRRSLSKKKKFSKKVNYFCNKKMIF